MEGIKFETHYDRLMSRKRFNTECGTCDKADYEPVYDRAGVWHLEEKKTRIQTYMEIQSHADECDINLIMARYRNGETDVLSQVQGVYGDFTNVPTNYADILNDTLKMEQLFMSLAPEVREKFNNSVEQFGTALGTDEWQKSMKEYYDKAAAAAGSGAGIQEPSAVAPTGDKE